MNKKKIITRQPVPFPTAVKAERAIYWCACGLSQRQPFCDSSHEGTGIEPLAYHAPEDLTVAFCGCKRTRRPPFCDGSHARED